MQGNKQLNRSEKKGLFCFTKSVSVTVGALLVLTGCVASQPARVQSRSIYEEPTTYNINELMVRDFQTASDRMARSLIIQPFIQRAEYPPVITIRPVENKTGLDIDTEIFQETIRVNLMKNAGGSLLFRDDKSRQDIIMERANQNSQVSVKTIDELVEEKFSSQKSPNTAQGFGGYGTTQQPPVSSEKSTTKMKRSARVSGQIADVDYFLRGIIFSTTETRQADHKRGMRYWQYQFRVVDARTGLVVWEDVYQSKSEGRFN